MLVFGNCNVTKIATSMEAMISSVDTCVTRQSKAVELHTPKPILQVYIAVKNTYNN